MLAVVERWIGGLLAGLVLMVLALTLAGRGTVSPMMFNLALPFTLAGVPWESWAARTAQSAHETFLQALLGVAWVAVGTPLLWSVYYTVLPAIPSRWLRRLVTVGLLALHLHAGIMRASMERAFHIPGIWHDPWLVGYLAAYAITWWVLLMLTLPA